MKAIGLAITLLFVLSNGFTQQSIGGKIVDQQTKAPIAYVNIGVERIARGTVSDEMGRYGLMDLSAKDTVTVSAIGYRTRQIVVKELVGNGLIELEPRQYDIAVVEVEAAAFSEAVTLGENCKGRGPVSVGFGSRQLGSGIGSVIRIERSTLIKSAHFRFNHADGDSMLFRINLYPFTDGKAGESLLKESILVRGLQQRGYTAIDLSNYHLILEEDVLLTLEWVKDDNGKGNKGITFATTKSKRSRIYTKRTSISNYVINPYFRAPMTKKITLCFYMEGMQVKE